METQSPPHHRPTVTALTPGPSTASRRGEKSGLKLRFDSELPFQRHAINAVRELFAGQPLAESTLSTSFSAGPLALTEFGSGNRLVLDNDTLLSNLRDVQQANMVPQFNPGLPGMW